MSRQLEWRCRKGYSGFMKKASITEAKNNLSALIDGLKSGSSVLILDRGRPVARLEPVSAEAADWDERIARLVRQGLVRPRRKPVSRELFRSDLPATREGFSVLDALLEERREGR
jgi:antitoxin (DNA-binding transcriptional repressor) of toxin-antitoxin stability system